ncbi:Cytochrome P450 monooxygenase paxP [Drechslerella dactyloides]|uniref:Cytochrome P450 monooxygenase paxP n=1 Tax=Drechslerella dactyloides TaxID=74499 RepID=A0AAD6IUE1_DREDA|nr:Cytochrome P450 monooxygenase paxP [Drechslerella dactyloides]
MIVQSIVEFLGAHTTEVILYSLALFTVYSLVSGYNKPQVIDTTTNEPPAVIGLPTSLPWLFPKTRTRLASISNTHKWVQEGYQKYNKHGKAFKVHLISGDMIILPQDMVTETKNMPHNMVDIKSLEALAVRYTFDEYVNADLFHVGVIRKDLTARLAAVTPAIVEELDLAFRHYIPKLATAPDEKGWREVTMYDLVLKVVARTSHRVFLGEELCREEEYLDLSIKYAITVFPTGMLINCFPKFLHPIVGPILATPLRIFRRKARKFLDPIILKRLAQIRDGIPESERPNDLMQWLIEASLARGGGFATVDAIAVRVLTVAFAAIHTTSLSGTNTFYDLAHLSSLTPNDAYDRDPADLLRAELLDVFPPPHEFNKRYMQRLYNLDAFLKETLRLRLVGATHSERLVTARAGITTKSGLYLPYGTAFSFPGSPRLADPDVFEKPTEHRHVRFYRGDVANAADEDVDEIVFAGDAKGGAADKKLDRYMVTVTEDFPVFGVGVHACPGRFFAANELRILIAWFILRYDLKPIATRPPPSWFVCIDIMNTTARLHIREREVEE